MPATQQALGDTAVWLQARIEDAQDLRALVDCSGQLPKDLVEAGTPLEALLTPETPLPLALEAAEQHLLSAVRRLPWPAADCCHLGLVRCSAFRGQLGT